MAVNYLAEPPILRVDESGLFFLTTACCSDYDGRACGSLSMVKIGTLMAEVRLEFKILIYPEKGAWVAHCVEMDLPAEGNNPNEALKNLMDLVRVATAEQLGDVKARIHLRDSKYFVGNPIQKMRHMATKLTSTVEAFVTPIRQLPHRLLTGRAPPVICGHCGKASEPSTNDSIPKFQTTLKTKLTPTSFNEKENKMSDHDQDLSGDDVKFVEYSILSIKPNDEKILAEKKVMISGDMNGEMFTAKVITDNADAVKPYNASNANELRVFFKVLARYARPEQHYEKDQAASLKTIADVVVKQWGSA
jgi:hypothetical protein